MFKINKKVKNTGSIFKNKLNFEFYIKIDNNKYVRLIDNYSYTILNTDMELWTLIK